MINPYDWIEDSFRFEKKEYKACTKSEEEIKELLFDDSVPEVERMERNIRSDNFLRKTAVYNKLDYIFANQAICDRIFPIMKTQLPSDGKDMQMAASEGFSKALSQEQKPKQEILVDIFGLCLILLGQWNTEVIDEWIKVFNQVVSILDWAVMKDKLADLVNQLSQSSQPKQSRYAAAKIIVAIAKNKGKFMEGPIFNRSIHLCQDCEKEVRIVIASEAILPIYAALDTDVCRNILLEKILILIYDPNLDVKAHTVKMVVDLLDYIHKPDQRDKILNLFSELLINVNEEIILALSSKLCTLFQKSGDVILKNPAYLTNYLNFFKEVSKHKNDEVKCAFLFSLPGVCRLVDKTLFHTYKQTFFDLGRHRSDKVRLYWLTVLEDLVDLMADDDRAVAKATLDWMLESENDVEIVERLLGRLAYYFRVFYLPEEEILIQPKPAPTPKQQPAYNKRRPSRELKDKDKKEEKEKKPRFLELCRTLLVRMKARHRWRWLESFIIRMDEITQGEFIVGYFPEILDLIIFFLKATPPVETRKTACRFYTRIIVNLPKFDLRKTAIRLFVDEIHNEESLQSRITMLIFYLETIRQFSKHAIKFFIIQPLLKMNDQATITLKLMLAKHLPEISNAIDSTDEVTIKKFISIRKGMEESQNKLLRETVAAAINQMQLQSRFKTTQQEILNMYKANRALEESYLLPQYDDLTLDEIYRKESGLFVSKLSTVKAVQPKPGVKPKEEPTKPGTSTSGPVPVKPAGITNIVKPAGTTASTNTKPPMTAGGSGTKKPVNSSSSGTQKK